MAIRNDEFQQFLQKGGKKMTARCRFTSDRPVRFGIFFLERFDSNYRADEGAEIVPLQQRISDQKLVEETLAIMRSGLYVLRFLNQTDSVVELHYFISD